MATPWDNQPQKEHALKGHPNQPHPFRIVASSPRAPDFFCLIRDLTPWCCDGLRGISPLDENTPVRGKMWHQPFALISIPGIQGELICGGIPPKGW